MTNKNNLTRTHTHPRWCRGVREIFSPISHWQIVYPTKRNILNSSQVCRCECECMCCWYLTTILWSTSIYMKLKLKYTYNFTARNRKNSLISKTKNACLALVNLWLIITQSNNNGEKARRIKERFISSVFFFTLVSVSCTSLLFFFKLINPIKFRMFNVLNCLIDFVTTTMEMMWSSADSGVNRL